MVLASNGPSLAVSEREGALGLFFAVFPDPQTASRIGQLAQDLRRRHRLKGRPLDSVRFHCSLYGFGNAGCVSDVFIAKAQEAASLVQVSPFRVSFNCAMSFSDRANDHPLVLVGDDGVVGMARLRSSLWDALRKVGLRPRKNSSFTPHVTLLYDARHVDEQFIEPIGWTVSEFILVLSLIGRTKHIPIQRWQLRK